MSEATSNSRNGNGGGHGGLSGAWHKLLRTLKGRNGDSSLREAIEEIIDEISDDDAAEQAAQPISDDERVMLANLLKQRHLTAEDVMVPRADIVAIPVDLGLEELLKLVGRVGHSRLPVYRESLDDVLGLVHIKDVLSHIGKPNAAFNLEEVVRKVLFVAPSMRVLDLLLEMRLSRVHMSLVVDEFGGIDGLITIEDLVEEIVGEIEDEHDVAEGPKLIEQADGSLIADGRTPIEDLEEKIGNVLSEEDREEDVDTLGGFVFSLVGRVPTRGELVVHKHSGLAFEILQADPRRIKRMRVCNISKPSEVAAR